MNKPAAITAYVDADTLAVVEQLAAAQGRSVADLAAEAIRLVAGHQAESVTLTETALLASLAEAERQIDDGAFAKQEDVEDWIAGLRRDPAA
ncbi:ribbon-helix-helix protein, CopG family [Sphingomonas xinjiangensis]|uniref:Putative transcriptional regulator n=1 Tax=Sphingomonas xinjiangensis TaxID=643568 RepID=A0A840YQR5_9SPHN|nr:ribbon-helix-helix protein, CopG family [Sphingomonas xinjiangensis]MBB5711262.1 putative transcriptional regulator [Sphingomonas xinjiangensis]